MTNPVPYVYANPHPSILTISFPFLRMGLVPFGGRATLIRLSTPNSSPLTEKDLFVISPTPKLDEATKAKVEAFGKVKYIVAPDLEHQMGLKDWHEAFPDAELIGPEGVQKKYPDYKFSKLYREKGGSETLPFESEIRSVYFNGFVNKDIAFYHPTSKTLITADLLFNLPGREQYSSPHASKIRTKPGFLHPFASVATLLNYESVWHKRFLWYVGAKNREQMCKAARETMKWDFERLIMCHGDVIEGKGKEAWRSAYEWFLAEGQKQK